MTCPGIAWRGLMPTGHSTPALILEQTVPPDFEPLSNGLFHLALEPDGDVVVEGLFTRVFRNDILRTGLARFKPDGVLDETFDPQIGPRAWQLNPNSLAIIPDGKIVIAGAFTNVNGFTRTRVARLNPDGTFDPFSHPSRNQTFRFSFLKHSLMCRFVPWVRPMGA